MGLQALNTTYKILYKNYNTNISLDSNAPEYKCILLKFNLVFN